MTPRSELQQKRQKHRARDGKYDKVNPCYICGNSAGENYVSDQRTDSQDSEGNEMKRVLIILLVYAPVAFFVMLPLYVIGAICAVIWTCLEIGYEIGLRKSLDFVSAMPPIKKKP